MTDGDKGLVPTERLKELETVIERGQQTFIEVGQALMEIRDGRLYRQQFNTFEDYCEKRWGWTRHAGYQYIRAAEVARNVELTQQTSPSLTQAVQLATLRVDQQQRVASEVDFSTTTVRELRDIVRETRGIVHCTVCGNHYDGVKFPSYCPYCELTQDQRIEGLRTASKMDVHYSSDSVEWYTPEDILRRVEWVLGQIDLDPCSNSTEAPNVPARHHFTQEHDGLRQTWEGAIYMNPPYGRVIDEWIAKLVQEYDAGHVTEAIALVPARTDTDWFRRMRDCAVCFIDGRLRFSGMENSAPFPSAVVYFGSDVGRFSKGFEDIGDVWVRWEEAS